MMLNACFCLIVYKGHAKLAALLDDGSGERDNLRGDTLLWAAVCNSDWKQVAQLAKTVQTKEKKKNVFLFPILILFVCL